jgi:hypothetical protein
MCSDFIIFRWLENLHVAMPAKHNHPSFGIRLGDHYMMFTKVPLCQSCILLRFPHLGPLSHQADPRYSHTLPCCSRTRHIPKVPKLVSKLFHTGHVMAHVALGGWLLRTGPQLIRARTIHKPWRYPPSPPYLNLAQTPIFINCGSTHIAQDGRPQTIIAQSLHQDEWLNIKDMTVGLSKAIIPICKPTSSVKIQESKQPRIHYFMHNINSK